MAEVLLFHHAHGLTPGVHGLADALTAAGHAVHVPDLYEGEVFDDLEQGVAHATRSASSRSSDGPSAALPGYDRQAATLLTERVTAS